MIRNFSAPKVEGRSLAAVAFDANALARIVLWPPAHDMTFPEIRGRKQRAQRGLVRFAVPLLAAATTASNARATPTQDPASIESSSEIRSESPGRAMSLDEALSYARAHHPEIAAAQKRIEAATKDAAAGRAEWLPRVGALAEVLGSTMNNSTASMLGASTVDLPRIGATKVSGDVDWNPYPTTAVAIGVRQELYDFGRIAAENAAATLQTDVERYRAEGAKLDVAFAVAQAYYAVLAAVAIRDASQAAFERAAEHRDFARANVRSGLRPPIELTRAEADVARYEAGIARARGSLHVARSVFAATVGIDDLELDAAGGLAKVEDLPSLTDYLGRADTTPAVLESRAKLEAQKAATKGLEAKTRPNLVATASISGRAGGATPSTGPLPTGAGWIPAVPNYDVGVVLSWPILDLTWKDKAAASSARESALAADAELALRNQRAAIVRAWHETHVATSAVASLEHGADAALANYEQADRRFAVGLGTSTELADAQALRTEADIQLAVGRFQMARARAALERAAAEMREAREVR